MTYAGTRYRIPISYDSLVMVIYKKGKYTFRTTAILLFKLQKKTLPYNFTRFYISVLVLALHCCGFFVTSSHGPHVGITDG